MKKGYALLSAFLVFLLLISASHEKTRDINKLELNAEGVNSLSPGALTVDMDFGKFPLYFISNKGQVHEIARFYAKTSRYTLWLTKQGLVFDSTRKVAVGTTHPAPSGHPSQERHTPPFGHPSQEGINQLPHSPYLPKIERDVSRLIFINADNNPEMLPVDETKLKVNYFIGNDRTKWHGDVPTSQAVLYKNLYKSIDLKVYGIEKQIEYDWIVKPGGNPGDIRFEYQNVKGTRLDNEGNLLIETDFGELVHKKPVGYQNIDNKKCMIKAGFKKVSGNIYGFSVGEYNKDYELIIDPVVLAYSTYLGGGSYEHGYGIKADGSGNVYVTGHTNSTNFPCLDQYSTDKGGCDVIVSKIDTTQSGTDCLVYSTYLGGGGFDNGYGIAVDSNGIVYITGFTESGDFPILNQYQTHQGGRDAFAAKIDTTQSGTAGLIYSTYLGGAGFDEGRGIELDSSGNVYITGSTSSYNFPILNQYQADQGGDDAFIAKIDTTQNGAACLIYSTYLGGSSADYGHGIALDNSGYVYVAGATKSNNFPTLNQYQTYSNFWNYFDAYVTKIDTTKSGAASLIFSTYLGGKDNDEGFGIAVDNSGNAYVTGYTQSYDFPTRNAYQSSGGGWYFNIHDVFVTRIDTTQSGYSCLIYSTYLGGYKWSNEERGRGIAVDNNGCAYVTGYTGCTDFPTLNQFQTDKGGDDAFVTKIDTTKSGTGSLVYSTYLGGGGHEYGYAIALDSSGSAYVTGRTASYDFPVLNQYQVNSDDYWDDVFITKISPPQIDIISPNGDENFEAGSLQNITWSSAGVDGNVKIEYSIDNGANWLEIVSSTTNDGTHPWTIPDSPSGQCLVKISEIDGSPSITSDSVFSIIPAFTITLTSPNGGENWQLGTTRDITWTSTGFIANVKIEYSLDNGANWSEIAASTENDGVYSWTIPGPASLECKVRVSDTDGVPISPSIDVFSITYPNPLPQSYRSALIDLYNNTGGDNWTNNTGWKTPPLYSDGFSMPGTENTWHGITLVGNSYVETINLQNNNLSGIIPDSIGNLSNLVELNLSMNQLTGVIPLTLSNLSNSVTLNLSYNQLSGAIPDGLGSMTNLMYLYLHSNQLQGVIPTSITNLFNLVKINFGANQLSGNIPPGFGTLLNLQELVLGSNQLDGNIPVELGNLTNLLIFDLHDNHLTGTIPTQIGNILNLATLTINNNDFSGGIPSELGNLSNLQVFKINSNQLIGAVPVTLTNLASLTTGNTDIGYNALYTDDETLQTFLNGQDPDWQDTQTIAPTDIAAAPVSDTSVEITWTPITYSGDAGGYQVSYSTTTGGSYTFFAATADKTSSSMIVTGLNPDTPYYFVVHTRTEPHDNNANTIDSENSIEVSATTYPMPSIEIIFPDGGENLEVGTVHNISWFTAGLVGNLNIEYSTDNGNTWTMVVSSTENDGTHPWTIPDTLSGQCRVRISETDGNPSNVSNNVFSIIPPPAITVTIPGGNENWEVGSTYDINWISEGIVGDVKIEYSIDNGGNWIEIVPSTGNDGAHPWTIPGNVSNECRVRVSETDGNPNNISNVFSIVPIPGLDVLSPDGDENWQAGSSYNITWSSTGIVGDVKIEYSVDNGVNWMEIVPATPNDGSHPWMIPDTPSDQCRVRISETDGIPYSISSGVFSIDQTPTIQVTTPNWGENLEVGSIINISWHSIGVTGNVNIDYSLDNGTNWINIIFSTANDGNHPWQVPASLSSACLVRISETNGILSDISDITFSIVPKTPLPPVSVSCTAAVPDHMEVDQEVQFAGDFSVSGNEGIIVKTDNIIGNMRYIPLTGSRGFIQGSPETDPGHSFSGWEDQFEHVITRNIAAMETEITRQMWTDLKALQSSLPDDPSSLTFSFELNQPVQYVSWYKAVLFANLLSLQNGFTPCYYTDSTKTTLIDATNYDNNNTIYCDFSANGYRLPTEGEWEYLARAGTTTPFWIDEPNFNSSTLYTCTQGDLPALETASIFCANSGNVTSPPGSKLANPWNLYDVHGNVSEWCWDFFSSSYPTGIITDYPGPGSGTGRCLRGGGFVEDPLRSRSAYRKGTGPGNPNFYYGFRLVRNLSTPTTTYKWSFGDLDYAYERNAAHVYSSPSFYGWKLTVTHNGQVCEKTGMIEITPANSISITFPFGSESFEVGTIQNIRWTSVGVFEYVKIEYSADNGSNWTDINASTENDGSYPWIIPNTVSNQCLVRISETDGDPVETSNSFSIIPPLGTIEVTSPDGGEGYEPYMNPVITWTTTGTVGNVTIELSTDNGVNWLELVYSTENDGSYIWLVPDQVSNQCLIRISETDGYPSNTSDNVFSILPPGSLIELISPNGGENWEVGTTQNITWDAPALLSSLIIEYSTDMGNTWKTITSSTPDDGSHPWVIPKVVSNGCLVRIRESDNIPTDTSNGFFSISSPVPFFNVTFPDGGETLTGLSLQNITWTSYNIYGYIKIEYSTDGGGNWTGIASNVIDVGSYAWSVPNGLLTNCLVRVSTMDGTIEDTSESSFTISYTDPRPPEIERLALIDLYNSTNGDNWTNNSGWKEPPLHTDGFAMPGTENSWYGVTVIGNSHVERLELRQNNLTGTLPFSIGNFSNLQWIDFYFNNIGGNIPASIGNLSNLEYLSLQKNQLTGTIPDTIGNLQSIILLYLNENQLNNGIPSSIGNLTSLQTLVLADNNLGGTIPTEIGNLVNLTLLNLGRNSIGGNIPNELGNLVNLMHLQLYENYLIGSIPASIGNLTNLIHINLNNNSLSGNIPLETGNLVDLGFMGIRANKLSGEIPTTMANLIKLNSGNTDIGYNALYTNDDPLRIFLDAKDPDWKDTQTIAPAGVTTAPVSSTSVQVNWTPILYTADTGGYQVHYTTTAGGPYTLFDTTADKTASSMLVTGLTPETPYCFVVRTRTEAHANNLNIVESENSAESCDNTPQPASIEVTFPNGGETLATGTSPGITWSTLGIVGNVKIEYSTTGETGPYTIITAAAANTGIYNGWTVPDEPSTNCFIKISEVDGNPMDISNGSFSIVPAPTISGTVTSGGVVLANVVMSGLLGNPVTNASGFYTAQVSYNWSGTVTPTLAGYTFIEPSTTYSNVTTAQTTNYTATIITYTISGTITHGGAGLQNVVMNGLPGTPLTDASGFYTAVVNYGWSGTATPTLAGYTFTSPSTTYTNVTMDQTTDYTAELTDQIPIIERQALIDLYNSTNGDTWINNSGWKTPPLHTDDFAMPGTEWSWHGVTVETDNHVTRISLGSNNLQGAIPASIGDLLYLTEIYLYTNQLTGSIPAEITSLQGLQIIDICSTQLSGPLPLDLGNLVNLRFLYLYSNQLSGEIPISIGNCVELIRLYLDDNQLTGKVPAEIGNLTKLERIDLSGNKLQGPLPIAVTNLTSLSESFTESGYNALYTEDESIRTFMNSKDPDWESTQTIAPSDVSTANISEESVEISWTPIVYTGNSGMYVVRYGTTPGGPYPDSVTTENKTVSSITVTNLSPATTYYFVVQTLTEPHENNENIVESDYSQEVSAATLARPALRVTSPNVGENLIVGSTYEITWMSNRVVGDIKIEYSIDNGAAWLIIVPTVDNNGSYYWTVPDTPSASCLVRISECDKDNGLSDVSDGGFSIISAPFITIKSPNGRETWVVGSYQQITWTGTGIDGNVKIEYSTNNGAFWTTITGSTDNNGIFNWFVPDTPSENCMIRISDIDGAPADVSDNVFSITQPPTITVTSPNGGENWNAGSTQHITWTGSGTIGKVKIDYSPDNGATWTGIAASLDNNGSYPWIVPDNPSDNCLVRISEIDVDNGPSDVSNAVFSIIPGPVITIISPNGNENLEAGSVYNITWTSNGTIGELKLEYSTNNGGSWAVIEAATVNDGSHSWAVPDNPSKSCLIRISETDGEPADISDSAFSIESPSTATITIISPNGGENLTIGTTWQISWTSTGMQANDNVIIEYSIDSGGSWIIIKPSIVSTGSYDWTVPDNPSANCLLRINGSDSDEGPADVSDAVFSIESPAVPTITVTSPNGGETLTTGSTHEITWTTSGMESVENIIIEYSTDSGTTWTAIVFSTSDIGSSSWTVPEHPADNCLIRIRVSDQDEGPSDTSDEVFSIIPGMVITVTSPNGGEQWKTGSTYNIAWTSEGITGDVVIDLYRGDSFDLNIGTVPLEQGTFAWNIPGNLAVGDDYKILLHKDTTEDYSDGNFSIVDIETNNPDFNNDGHVDILWRNYVSGNNEVWLMNGPVRSSSSILPVNPDLNWRIVGTWDFNRDGKVDILWRNYTNGQNQVWYMDGSTQTGFEYLTPNPDINSQIAGTGDFNGDGNIDILWRNPLEGRNQVWHLDGITVTGYKGLPSLEDPAWRIAGIGDFNNDDKVDILWRNYVTGSNQVWVMDGTTRTGIIDVPELTDLAWQVAGTGDFNRDGNIDILWRRYADGMNMVWYMDGIVRLGYEYIEPRSDVNWRIVGNGDYKD